MYQQKITWPEGEESWAEQVEVEELIEVPTVQGEGVVCDDFILRGLRSHETLWQEW